MKTALELLETFGEQIAPVVIIGYLLNYFIKNRAFFEQFFKMNYNHKISSLQNDLHNLKKNKANKGIRKAIKLELEFWQFVKLTGYAWNRNRRSIFLKFIQMTNGELNMKWVKLLFANSTVKDGVVKIKISNMTKFGFICRFLFALIMFAFLPLLGLLFHTISDSLVHKIVLYVLFGIALVTGIHNIMTLNKEWDFLKKMKVQYDNTNIE